MRGKKILKITGISLVILITLALLFVVAFIFNPFEGSVNDVRDLVPRSSQFFVRKVDLKDDFAERDGKVRFPEPHFWESLARSEDWGRIERGPTYASLEEAGVPELFEGMATAVDELAAASGGTLSLLDDVIGTEFILAGRYADMAGNPLSSPWLCMFTRVSWKVRFGWGLAQWSMVQSKVAEGGGELVEEDGFLRFTSAPGATPVYLFREKDCLMASTGKEFLDVVRQLLQGVEGVESLAQSSEYRAAIDGRLDQWAESTGASDVNAIEYSLRPNDLPFFKELAATWPNPMHPESMNQRVLASFLRLAGWKFINGGVVFERGGGLGVVGQVNLDSNNHSPFQSKFFRAEARPHSEWLDPFLDMVPSDACATMAFRVPARDFLEEMFNALDPEEKTLLDDAFRSTGAYDSTRGVIDAMEFSLEPRVGIIFRENRPDTSPERPMIAVPSPAPHIAWVFWVEENMRKPVREFVEALRLHQQSFSFTRVMKLGLDIAQSGDEDFKNSALEFYHPQIPGTGEIATLIFDRFFIVSNSGPFIKEMINTQFQAPGHRSVRSLDTFRQLERELPERLSGFIHLNGPRLSEVMDDFEAFSLTESAATPDADFMLANRPLVEADVRRTRFGEYPNVTAIPPERAREFDEAVKAELIARWAKERTQYTADDRAGIQEAKALFNLLDHASIYFELQSTRIDFTGHFLFDY